MFHPQVGKRVPVHILHGDPRHVALLVKVVNPHDVMVRQGKAAPRLALEILQCLAIRDQHLGQEFQCHLAVELFVLCEPHHAHPAAPNRPHQPEPPEEHLPSRKPPQRRSQFQIIEGFRAHDGRRTLASPVPAREDVL